MVQKTTFNNISIGRKFKTNFGITYTKVSEKEAKPFSDAKGKPVQNKNVLTSFFYNSTVPVIPL
jgi:hypothetical protein